MNLVEEGFDAAVRISSLEDSSLIARKLANVQGATIAAPQYLAKRGTPSVPEDLRKHEAILDLNMADPYTWIFRAGSKRLDVRVSGRLRFWQSLYQSCGGTRWLRHRTRPRFCRREQFEKRRAG